MAAIDASECLADHDGQIESLRHGLDPAGAAGADHGEIEPRGGADITVDHRPQWSATTMRTGGSPAGIASARARCTAAQAAASARLAARFSPASSVIGKIASSP